MTRFEFDVRWVLGAAAIAGVLLSGCKTIDEPEGLLLAQELVGPEGGMLSGRGLTVTIPAGALTTETEIELRGSEEDLTRGDHRQRGAAFGLHPAGLFLRQPATVEFTHDGNEDESAAVLFTQDGLVVASAGRRGYINELGTVALSDAGKQRVMMVDPALASTPDAATTTLRDLAHMALFTEETPRLNISLTIYDAEQAYDKPLNGTGEGDCGFRLQNVLGGSLAAGCAGGPFTATIGVTSSTVEFDAVPFLSGKLETPVLVGVVAGGDELAHALGFMRFDTSPCFQESCSGRGTCEIQGDGTAACTCDQGFAPIGLTCDCVPQCEGRSCGSDGCGGQCAPGCSGGESCEEGTCVPDGTGEEGGGSTTSGDAGTTGDGTTGGGTTSGTGGGTTGGGTTGA